MLLTHRRQALLTFSIAGMQLAWVTAFALTVLPAWARASVAVTYVALFGVVLLWLLLLDALNHFHVASPRYELAVAGLVIASTLFFLRLFVFGGDRPATDLTWPGQLVRTLFELRPGVGQVLAVIVVNIILWQRAAAATGREISFFAIGFSFRLGLLLLIAGAALVEQIGGIDVLPLLWFYFAFGLLALALARIEDKAYGASSQGTPLPRTRLAQLFLAVAMTVAIAALIAHFYTRSTILGVIVALMPLWRGLGFILGLVLIALGWLLTPIMLLLEVFLRKLLAGGVLDVLREMADRLAGIRLPSAVDPNTPGASLPAWVGTGLRYGAVLLVLLILLGFVLLYLERRRRERPAERAERERGEEPGLGAGALGAALTRLRDLAGLVRRYGLNRQLLAAVSVQNIYANLTRLARLRGYPRRPAQPPDDYLPVLCQVFPGAEAAQALARITAAYMRVHYGDRPVTFDELAALRLDYRRVRRSRLQEERTRGR